MTPDRVLFDAHGVKLTTDHAHGGVLLHANGRFRLIEWPLARRLGEAILAAIPEERTDA